jgi:hypothetical protein
MVQVDKLIEERIKFATFINEQNLQLIASVDQKTSIIIAINGVILGLLSQTLPIDGTSLEGLEVILTFSFFWSAVGLLGASAIFGVWTIMPRIDKNGIYSDSMVFHETIVRKLVKDTDHELISEKFKEYKRKLESVSPEDILHEEGLNAFRLAYALKSRHFKYLRWSLRFLFSGLIPLILFLLCITVFSYPNG